MKEVSLLKKYKRETTKLSVIACGDIMTHGIQIKSAYDEKNKSYDFGRYFKYAKRYIENADLAICNVETTMAGGGMNIQDFLVLILLIA